MSLAERSAETYTLPVTSKGVMRLSPRLRETYLTPETNGGTCMTQACGTEVKVWLWSDRHNIRLTLQRDGFEARRPYEQSVHRWGVSVNRYTTDDADGRPGLQFADEAGSEVEVVVDTFEGFAL